MEADSIAQIKSNLGTQTCQAFDPMMLLENKAEQMQPGLKRLKTSCVAPAYAYIEGAHGKKYLCDFHYIYEKSTLTEPEIQKVFALEIENFQLITETFPKELPDNNMPDANCWCNEKAYVFQVGRKDNEFGFCSFHFRKLYYRGRTNDIETLKEEDIIDYRYLLRDTNIKEDLHCMKLL